MTDLPPPDEAPLKATVSAYDFLDAWHTVSVARADDDSRPLLATVCVEFHDDGLCLVATNGFLILWSWLNTGDLDSATRLGPDDLLERDTPPHALVHDWRGLVDALVPAHEMIVGTLDIEAVGDEVAVRRLGSSVAVERLFGPFPNWRGLMTEAEARDDGRRRKPAPVGLSGRALRLLADCLPDEHYIAVGFGSPVEPILLDARTFKGAVMPVVTS